MKEYSIVLYTTLSFLVTNNLRKTRIRCRLENVYFNGSAVFDFSKTTIRQLIQDGYEETKEQMKGALVRVKKELG